MCTTCGCSNTNKTKERKIIPLEEAILKENNDYAQANKNKLRALNITTMNMVASPGAGKTSLLMATGKELKDHCSVIVGDQATEYDANRLKEQGLDAVQVFTKEVCHLDAHMISHALEKINLKANSVLFIENVGNLICPALFDLGEDFRVVLLSVTEGEDKPLKYPYMFGSADLVILTKIDLLPYLQFDIQLCMENIKSVNPKTKIIQLSSQSGEGIGKWLQWLKTTKHKIVSNLTT